jgi:Cupin superfamily protein.
METTEQMTCAFDRIVHPIPFDEFLASYYEKRPLLIKRRDSSYYNDIVTVDQINAHLGQGHITYPGIRLIKDGEEVDSADYTDSVTTATGTTDGIVNKEKLFAHFYDGHTIILNWYERHSAGVLHLRHITERAFHANAHANLYITPRTSRGFGPHWDNHDVFILQFEGKKAWTVYDSPVLLPGRKRQFVDGEWNEVDPTLKATLEPGDLLYLPRGFVHEANATDEVSCHITLGIDTYTYADLALRLLEQIDDDPWFRRSLPRSFKTGIDPQPFHQELARFIASVDLQTVTDGLYAEFASARLPDSSNRLLDYIRLRDVNVATTLQRKPDLFFDVQCAGDEIVLHFNDKALRFPSSAGECMQSMLQDSSFQIGTLPGEMDTESKIALCRKLVEEGFLGVIG